MTVNFTCSALGGPGNNFTWFKISDSAVVASEPVFQIAVEDAFIGSDYQCLVENEAGNDTAVVTLNGMFVMSILKMFPVIFIIISHLDHSCSSHSECLD